MGTKKALDSCLYRKKMSNFKVRNKKSHYSNDSAQSYNIFLSFYGRTDIKKSLL